MEQSKYLCCNSKPVKKNSFLKILPALCKLTLPGVEGQLLMAPPVRAGEMITADTASARPSGVVLLFYADPEGDIRLILMQRTEYGGVHSGQISFPGGKWEPGDTDIMHTALREFTEEIGVTIERSEIFLQLSDLYIPPSHFLVSAFMAYIDYLPVFSPDPLEVAAVITPGLDELLSPEACGTLRVESSRYGSMDVPCYTVDGNVIWGATAMILSEALQLIREAMRINQVS